MRQYSFAKSLLPSLLPLLLASTPLVVDACGRQPARVQLPPAEYLRPFVFRKVPCEPHEQIYCANGGRCTVAVKWSVAHSRIEERLDQPSCECPSGYTGYNCDIPLLPSTLDLSTAAFVSVFLFVALLLLLLLVLGYLCCARLRHRRLAVRQPAPGDEPLATVAMLTDYSVGGEERPDGVASSLKPFDPAAVLEFIDAEVSSDDEDDIDGDDWRG